MPTGQQYATNVPQTTLTGLINATATVMSVASSSGWPTTPFTAILDIGTSTQEPVDVTNITGTTWTVVRAIDGTVGFTHQVGATVTHGDIGRDFREMRSHIDASTAVHGLGGGSAVVGTTDVQTLTNKTLTSPTVQGAGTNFSGTIGGNSLMTVQTLTVTGIGGSANSTRFVFVNPTFGPPAGANSLGDTTFDTFGNMFYCTAGGTPGTWTPVNGVVTLGTTKLGASAASVLINLPSNLALNRIQVFWRARGDAASGVEEFRVRLNGDTGSNYLAEKHEANNAGSTSTGPTTATSIQMGTMAANTATANYFSSGNFTVEGLQDSTRFATMVGVSGAFNTNADTWNGRFSGQHLSSATTGSITLFPNSGNFIANSTFTVIGYM